MRNIRKNMKFFGNPTLVSSRPKHDIVEEGSESSFRPTISSQAGFASASVLVLKQVHRLVEHHLLMVRLKYHVLLQT